MMQTEFLSLIIKQGLTKAVDKKDPSHITMSSLGHCARQLAYRYHGVEGKPLSWRTMMVFKDGDMAHTQLRAWIADGLKSASSCYQLIDQEKEVNYQGILGHVDGILGHCDLACSNTSHKPLLLEVKSMNDRGFKMLQKTGELGKEYRCQVSGYLGGAKLDEALILVKNKNTGELLEYRYLREDDLLRERIAVLEALILSGGPEDVGKEYGPNTRGNLPWQCGYCPFTDLCWRDYEVIEKKEHVYHVNMKLFAKDMEIQDAHSSSEVESGDVAD